MNKLCIAASLLFFSTSAYSQTLIEDNGSQTGNPFVEEAQDLINEADKVINNLLMQGQDFVSKPVIGDKTKADLVFEEAKKYRDQALKYRDDIIECATGLDAMPKADNPLDVKLEKHQIIALILNDELNFNLITAHDPKSGLTYTFNDGTY